MSSLRLVPFLCSGSCTHGRLRARIVQVSKLAPSEVLVGPQRLPEGLRADTTPVGTKETLRKLMEPDGDGAGLGREEAALEICRMAADKFGYVLGVRALLYRLLFPVFETLVVPIS